MARKNVFDRLAQELAADGMSEAQLAGVRDAAERRRGTQSAAAKAARSLARLARRVDNAKELLRKPDSI
jgi:hypothetical protein